MSEWQPIETAPSDTVVLLYTPHLHVTNPERIEARIYHVSRAGSRHAWATHWMPLPAPPSQPDFPHQFVGTLRSLRCATCDKFDVNSIHVSPSQSAKEGK
jgi:hypothetical protein